MGGKGSKEAQTSGNAEMHSRKPDISDKADKSGGGGTVAEAGTAALVGGATVKGIFSIFGFSSAGPVAGSAFATAQSIGMTSVLGILSAPLVIGAAIGGGTYGAVKVIGHLSKSNDQTNGDAKGDCEAGAK